MGNIKTKYTKNRLLLCIFAVYIVNVISKTSFSATTVALVSQEILTKTQAGLIGGAFWLIYAVGQFSGGFAVKKISPYVMIAITIIGSAIANIAMPCFENFAPMIIIWSINGICQFGMWPAILSIVSTEVDSCYQVKTMSCLSYCYCIGSVISYGLTAFVLMMFSWKVLFVVSGITVFLSIIPLVIIKQSASSKLFTVVPENNKKEETEKSKLTSEMVLESGFVLICILMFIKSMTDVGIKNWMPTIMTESFAVTPAFTTLLSVFMLIINAFGVMLCTYIYKKTKNNEIYSLCVIFLVAVPVMLLWINIENLSIYVATLLISAVTILFYASGQLLQMNYPLRFKSYGLAATVGGIINCFSALGNVAATYGCGYVADKFGWNTMIYLWNLLVILGAIITIVLIPVWNRFRKNNNR